LGKLIYMENLSWVDILGPILTTLSAIIALSGNPYKERARWYARLNWRGYFISGLIIISVFISIRNANKTNLENKVKFEFEKTKYESLNNNYDSIKRKLETSIKSKDSLNSIIKKLDKDFVEATVNELIEQRKLISEDRDLKLRNLKNEVATNMSILMQFDENVIIPTYLHRDFPLGNYSDKYFMEALTIPIKNELRSDIVFSIQSMKNINTVIDQIRRDTPGEAKQQNIKLLIEMNKLFKIELFKISKMINITIKDNDIKFSHNKKEFVL